MMPTPITILLVAVLVVAIILIVVYNGLVTLRNKVNEAFALMDVHLVKRAHLIPELVATVKGYALHEAETLQHVAEVRTNAMGRRDLLDGETRLGNALDHVIVVAESNPDLKANENFLKLQEQLVSVEEDIACARRYYNGAVREFNNKCQTFPNNLAAMMFGFKSMPSFEAKADERETTNVTF